MNYKKVTTTALSLLLTVGLAASLVACGNKEAPAPDASPTESPAPSP